MKMKLSNSRLAQAFVLAVALMVGVMAAGPLQPVGGAGDRLARAAHRIGRAVADLGHGLRGLLAQSLCTLACFI